ncbi:MAG TPA: hypothetical protein PKN28_02595 [Clostridiales bacterium]|nr:hypothetical protein [Clostridiales bacterium]
MVKITFISDDADSVKDNADEYIHLQEELPTCFGIPTACVSILMWTWRRLLRIGLRRTRRSIR